MNILALDQASKTGYAIFKNNKLHHWGLINLEKFSSLTQRAVLKQKLLDIIINYKINKILYENIFAYNIKTYVHLAKIQGTIEDLSTQLGIPCEEINSRHWKNVILNGKTPRGNKAKEAVKKTIINKYKQLPQDISTDITDAIGIGLCWIIENQQS